MDVLRFMEMTLRAAGEVVMSHFNGPRDVTYKADQSVVTKADIASEAVIVERIRTFFPEDKIQSEECGLLSTDRSPGSAIWICDPLDGSANFASGLGHFCISIARAVFLPGGGLSVLVGGVFDPVHDKMYLAERGFGATVNGEPMRVRLPRPLSRALLGTSIYPGRGMGISQDITCYEHVAWHCSTIRRSGAAALDLARTAEGIYDAYFEIGLRSWDMAAGSLLVTEAHGAALNYCSHMFSVERPSIVAGSIELVRELSEIVAFHYAGKEVTT